MENHEVQFKEIFNQSPIGILLHDNEGVTVNANNSALKIMGISLNDILRHNMFDYIPINERKSELIKEGIIKFQAPLNFEKLKNVDLYSNKKGVLFLGYTISVTDSGFLTQIQDITELKQIENIIQARSRLLEFASSHSMDELLAATLDEIEDLTGSTMGFYVFLKQDQRTVTLENWSTNTLKMCAAVGKGSHYDIDQAGVWVDCVYECHPVIHNDYASLPHRKGLPEGHIPLIRELVVPIFRGKLIKAIIAVANKFTNYGENDIEIVSQLGDLSWDIIESKKAEEKLKNSERGLAEAQRIAHLGSWELDIVNNALYWSDEAYQIFGLQREEFGATYKAFLGLVHPDDRKAVDDAYFGSIREGRDTYEIEHRIIRKSTGEVRVVHEKCQHFRDETGRIIRSIGMVHDITERKKAEERIQMLANVVESSDDAIITKSLEGVITSWNKGAESIYGYSEEEVLGEDISIVAPPQLKDEIKQLIEKVKHCEHVLHYETIRVRKDGKEISISVTLSPIFDTSKNLIGISTIARDITERKNIEEELRKSHDKLELKVQERTAELDMLIEELRRSNDELRRFAYVSSHDLQEPLRTIASFTQLLERRYKGKFDSDADEFMNYIVDAAKRMQQLINDLLQYSRVTLKKKNFML